MQKLSRRLSLILLVTLVIIVLASLAVWRTHTTKSITAQVTSSPLNSPELSSGYELKGSDGALYTIGTLRGVIDAPAGTTQQCVHDSQLQVGETIIFNLPEVSGGVSNGVRRFEICYTGKVNRNYYIRKQ